MNVQKKKKKSKIIKRLAVSERRNGPGLKCAHACQNAYSQSDSLEQWNLNEYNPVLKKYTL